MATITNSVRIDFASGESGDDAYTWKLFTSENGGTELWSADFTMDPDALTVNQFYRIESGALPLRVPPGDTGATNAMAARAVLGMVSTPVWIELYDVDGNSVTNRRELKPQDWNLPTHP